MLKLFQIFVLSVAASTVSVTLAEDLSGKRRAASIYEAMAALSKTPETIYGRYIMRNFVARYEKADAEQI